MTAPPPYYPPPYPIPPPPPSHPMRQRTKVLIVLAVLGAVMITLVASYALFHAGRLSINVTSDHLLDTVVVTVTVNGNEVWAGNIGPLQAEQISKSVTWFGDACTTVVVVARSIGGGLGPQSDSASGSLCGGQDAVVNLVV